MASLPHTISSHIVPVFMKSMFLLAFHCFLRIGECTASKDKNCHLLTVQSVQCSNNISDCPIGCQFTMKTFKKKRKENLILVRGK